MALVLASSALFAQASRRLWIKPRSSPVPSEPSRRPPEILSGIVARLCCWRFSRWPSRFRTSVWYGGDRARHSKYSANNFESGSVAKQFTAAAIVLLSLDGKLGLDDPVRKYITELPDYGAPLTIRHLLNHTGGVRDWGSVLRCTGTAVVSVLSPRRSRWM